MIRGARAAASEVAAAAAAQAVIDGGGGAVDAVIAGFFGAAGAHPGVLFAPAVALLAGFGSGGRVFDGRAVQPGRGAARPRGFIDEQAIPDGARVAVPRSIGMLMLLSTRGRASLGELSRAGVAAAESAGARARAALLRKVGAGGVLAMRAPDMERAFVDVGGAVAGGALTPADIDEASPAESEAHTLDAGDGLSVFAPPFVLEATAPREAEAIVACDARGVVAALAYSPVRGGIAVPGLEVTLARDAIPVRRGVTRVAPGTPLPMASPIAIAVQRNGSATAVGVTARDNLDAAAVVTLARALSVENGLAELCTSAGGRSAIAVVTDGKVARAAQA